MTVSAAFVCRQTRESAPTTRSDDPMSSTETQKRKRTGAHYTPPELASFVADQIIANACQSKLPLRVLDPAIGDDVLMEALVRRLENVDVTGIDTERLALSAS